MTTSELVPESALHGGPPMEERRARLAAGADEITDAPTGRGLFSRERILLTLAATLMTAGVAAILIGWLGAADGMLVEEQMPYLISGGLLGLALSLIGAATLLAHWLTVLIKENRTHEAARRRDHEETEASRRQEHEALLRALRAGKK